MALSLPENPQREEIFRVALYYKLQKLRVSPPSVTGLYLFVRELVATKIRGNLPKTDYLDVGKST